MGLPLSCISAPFCLIITRQRYKRADQVVQVSPAVPSAAGFLHGDAVARWERPAQELLSARRGTRVFLIQSPPLGIPERTPTRLRCPHQTPLWQLSDAAFTVCTAGANPFLKRPACLSAQPFHASSDMQVDSYRVPLGNRLIQEAKKLP